MMLTYKILETDDGNFYIRLYEDGYLISGAYEVYRSYAEAMCNIERFKREYVISKAVEKLLG